MIQVKLAVVRGNPRGSIIEARGPVFLIGRSVTCQLRIDSLYISREHAAIEIGRGPVFLHDLESRNGTLRNGQPVTDRVRLRDGDELRFGPVVLRASIVSLETAAVAVGSTFEGRALDWLIADEESFAPDQAADIYCGRTHLLLSPVSSPIEQREAAAIR